jgi:prefoldin subunit 5
MSDEDLGYDPDEIPRLKAEITMLDTAACELTVQANALREKQATLQKWLDDLLKIQKEAKKCGSQ